MINDLNILLYLIKFCIFKNKPIEKGIELKLKN
jgi:hypothetical protein